MSMDRALIVDTLPSEKQPIGSAWAARMMGIGSVVGFLMYVLEVVQRISLSSHCF